MDVDFLCFGDVHERRRGPRFGETTAEIRHITAAVWERFWALFPTDICSLSGGGSRAESCIFLPFETAKFCNSMWFQFDPSQKCSHSSLLMSNGASAIIPCVIRITTDYVSAWLPTRREVVALLMRCHILAQFLVPRWCLFVCSACNGIHSFH